MGLTQYLLTFLAISTNFTAQLQIHSPSYPSDIRSSYRDCVTVDCGDELISCVLVIRVHSVFETGLDAFDINRLAMQFQRVPG